MANSLYNFQNLARYKLSEAITSSDSSVDVSWDGPTTESIETPYIAVVHAPKFANPVDDTGVELVNVTNNASGTLTIARGQEGTTASAHSIGDYLTPIASAEALNNAFEIIRRSSNDRFVRFMDPVGGGTDYNVGRENSGDSFRVTTGSGMGGTVLSDAESDGWMLRAPSSAIADGRITNNGLHFWLNQSTDELTFRVRYSDGTYKTGTVSLT